MKKKMIGIGLAIIGVLIIGAVTILFYQSRRSNQHVHQYLDGICSICGKKELKEAYEYVSIEEKEITFNKDYLSAKIKYTGSDIYCKLEEEYKDCLKIKIESEAIYINCLKPFLKEIELTFIDCYSYQERCVVSYQNTISSLELTLLTKEEIIQSNSLNEFQIDFLKEDSDYKICLDMSYEVPSIENKPIVNYELVMLNELDNYLNNRHIPHQKNYLFSDEEISFSWTSMQNYFKIDGSESDFDDYHSNHLFLINVTILWHDKTNTAFYILKDSYSRFQILDEVFLDESQIIF